MNDRVAVRRFLAVISSVLELEPQSLIPECSRDNLEAWDSIKHMYIILALEEEFAIEFADEEIAELSTLADLMVAITTKTGLSFARVDAREVVLEGTSR